METKIRLQPHLSPVRADDGSVSTFHFELREPYRHVRIDYVSKYSPQRKDNRLKSCSLFPQVRCMLNIWGVMLFIRLSWVFGQAGWGE